MVRKAWGQAWEAAGHICMQAVGREERGSLKMWFGVDGVRQNWYGSNQAEGHQLMFSVALRLDTWLAVAAGQMLAWRQQGGTSPRGPLGEA